MSLRLLFSLISLIHPLLSLSRPVSPCSPVTVDPAVFHLSHAHQQNKTPFAGSSSLSSFSSDTSSSDSAPVPELAPRTSFPTASMSTRVVPPPPVQTRRIDAPVQRRTIHPAKDACFKYVLFSSSLIRLLGSDNCTPNALVYQS